MLGFMLYSILLFHMPHTRYTHGIVSHLTAINTLRTNVKTAPTSGGGGGATNRTENGEALKTGEALRNVVESQKHHSIF